MEPTRRSYPVLVGGHDPTMQHVEEPCGDESAWRLRISAQFCVDPPTGPDES